MDAKQLAEIEARAQAATPGPWCEGRHDTVSYDGNGERPHKNVYGPEYDETTLVGERLPVEVARGEGNDCLANAIFIAHARADIPALLTALRERDAEIERMRAALDEVRAAARQDDAEAVDADTLRARLDSCEAIATCPHHDMFHFHGDGCPSCTP